MSPEAVCCVDKASRRAGLEAHEGYGHRAEAQTRCWERLRSFRPVIGVCRRKNEGSVGSGRRGKADRMRGGVGAWTGPRRLRPPTVRATALHAQLSERPWTRAQRHSNNSNKLARPRRSSLSAVEASSTAPKNFQHRRHSRRGPSLHQPAMQNQTDLYEPRTYG